MFKRQKEEAIAEKEKEVEELKKQLEEAKSASSSTEDKNKTQFKVYLTTAFDSLNRVLDLAKDNSEFKKQFVKMLDAYKEKLEEQKWQ